jgi:hypothetical protein
MSFHDTMRDRNLLYRVGSGWIFAYCSLLEHFAERASAKGQEAV